MPKYNLLYHGNADNYLWNKACYCDLESSDFTENRIGYVTGEATHAWQVKNKFMNI